MLEVIKLFVRRMLMGKGKGILKIPPQKNVDDFANDLFKKFKQNGVSDEAVTNPNDVKAIWNQITNREAQIFTNNLKDALQKPDPFKKAGEVFDLKGKKIKNPQNIMGGEEIIETEAEILARLKNQNKESLSNMRYEKAVKAEEAKAAADEDYIMKIFDPEDFAAGGRAGLYRGGQAQIEPDLSDIGHGSDALMARNTLLTPGSQATTSTGLNYLLGEDNDTTRVPYKEKGSVSLLDFINVNASGTKSGKNQIQGVPKGITVDSSTINAIIDLDIPINEKINLLGSYAYGKNRNKIEKGDKELFLDEDGYKDRSIGFGVNQGNEGLSGSVVRNLETGDNDYQLKFLKNFADGGRIPYGHGDMVLPKEKPMDEYMLKQVLSPAGIRTLDPKTREMFIEMYKKKIREKNSKADGGPARQNFGLGGMGRRAFLKWLGSGVAGIGAAKSGLFSLLKGGGKKQVIKELTTVPINNIEGMPVWFKPLVNKVIKEGDDVTKKFAEADRQIVHTTKLPNSQTDVIVTQDLSTGNVSVDIGMGKHGFADGLHGQPVRLEYKAAEDIMSGPSDEPFKVGVRDPHIKVKRRDEMTFDQKKHPDKAPEEFWVEEAEFTGGHPENVKFEDVTYEKFGQHGSNFDEVEKFATGKVKKAKTTESRFLGKKYLSEGDDMADGGRIGYGTGKIVTEGIPALIRALLKNKKKVKQAVDDIFPTGDYKYDAEMAADALVENNPKIFKNMLREDLSDNVRSEVYGAVLGPIQNNALMVSRMKRATKPTETLKGIEKTGTIDISNPGIADEFTRFMKETNPKGYKDIEEKVILESFDPKGKKGHATGGRVPMVFGGGIYKAIIKNLAKARGVNPSEYLKITNYKALPSEAKKYLTKADFEKMKAGRVEMFENWVDMARTRKEFLRNIEEGKKTSAAPIFEHMEQSFKSPVPSGVTDKDILQGEFILKNLKTKGRKLHSSGGLAAMLGE